MQARRYQQVDVFTRVACLGNPLAVVLDAEGLDTRQMQAFAAWTQLSETTFVLPPTPEAREAGADYRVRIFTPGAELPFAGHPTLGTAFAWLRAGGRPRRDGLIVQECGVGLVNLREVGARRAFAAPPLRRAAPEPTQLEAVLRALGLTSEQVLAAQALDNGPRWLGLLLKDVETVLALAPDHATLKRLGVKVGVAARRKPPGSGRAEVDRADAVSGAARTAPDHRENAGPRSIHPDLSDRKSTDSDPTDLEVRGFAAPVGVNEDPVTGSLNASLAQWLIAEGYLPSVDRARQGTVLGRSGEVFISRDPSGQVWVGGDVVGCIEGQVRI